MSTAVSPTTPPAPDDEIVPPVVTVVSRKAPIALTVLTVALALVVAFGAKAGDTTFRLSTRDDLVQLPSVTVPSTATAWALIVVMALCTAWSWWLTAHERRTPMWLTVVFAVASLTAFLCWAATGGTIPVVGLFAGAIALAVPLVFGAMSGVIGERAGVVNIAIDGQLLAGAFAAAMVGSITGSTYAGLVAAAAAGLLVALVLGLFAITYIVDQVIVGVVLNVLVIGVTSFLFSQVLAPNAATLNSPPRFRAVEIPVLGEIPIIGPSSSSRRSSST